MANYKQLNFEKLTDNQGNKKTGIYYRRLPVGRLPAICLPLR